MRRIVLICAALVLLIPVSYSHAGFLDDLFRGLSGGGEKSQVLDDGTIISGLKEALSIGTGNAVTSVSKLDGYFGNEAIRILMPENIQKVANVMRKVGFQRQVDEFVLSMNRAAEKAAPKAKAYFVDAIRQMSIADARGILNGGDTAATEYFKQKTSMNLYEAFKPIIAESMNDIGTTRAYKEMMGKYESIPFVDKESVDLDHYVANKSLDGLFHMVGQEEKKIRTDSAARVTDLLKKVFSR